MSALIPFGPVAPSAKPVFDPPDGFKYRVDGVQMELSWRPDFGAEKTAALQKAQFALAQEAARLIDSYVPFDTGSLKNSVNQASKYDEGLLVYNTPYARKQYYLHAEGTDLRGETGLRGSYWGQRAIADIGEHPCSLRRKGCHDLLGRDGALMSEKATITAMREWLKTCPLIAEEQGENGAAFRISGLSPEPVAEFSIEDSPTDPVTAVFFSGRNLAKSYIFISRRDYSEAQSVQIASSGFLSS